MDETGPKSKFKKSEEEQEEEDEEDSNLRGTLGTRLIRLGVVMRLDRFHHVAVIASDYERSKRFYTETLGLRVVAETYRAARKSYKLDLALPDGSQIELFSFPGGEIVLPGPTLRRHSLQLRACPFR